MQAFSAILEWSQLNDPLSATVESPIVGYTTVTTSPGFNMLGVVFNGLDGQTLTLNDIVSGDFQQKDEIQILGNQGYKIYRYDPTEGWYDANTFEVATDYCPAGTGFWLKTEGRSVEVTLKGAVPTGEYRYTSTAGLQLISMATPREIDLNTDVTWTGLQNRDEIQVRKNGAYKVYRYDSTEGWYDANTFEAPEKIEIGSSLWLKTQSAGAELVISGI